MREASYAAAEPRRSIATSRTDVRPLWVIHTGAPSLIKSISVLAPPDPRRLIFFNLHKAEEGQNDFALLVCTPRGNTKILFFLRTFLRNFPQNFRTSEKFLCVLWLWTFQSFWGDLYDWRGAPQGPFYSPFPPPYSGDIPYPLFTLAPGWNPVHTGAWFKTLFTLAPGSRFKPCSHWRPDSGPIHTGALIQGIFLGFCAQYRGPRPTFGSPLIQIRVLLFHKQVFSGPSVCVFLNQIKSHLIWLMLSV